jgi:hypothetical protein
MSLQLFANYENTANNSIFYRLTSVNPYNFTLHLQDSKNPGIDITDSYIVEYTLSQNLSERLAFGSDFTAPITLSAQQPTTTVISVSAYNNQDFTLNTILTLSAIFVPNFLSASFISFPQGFLSVNTPSKYWTINKAGTITQYLTALSAENIGNAFYGEGHTEGVALSTTTLNTGVSASWNIGPYNILTTNTSVSAFIPSKSNIAQILPVSLQLCNSIFLPSGPGITFPDLSGTTSWDPLISSAPVFYPFYSSSLTPTGQENINQNTFQRSLSVLRYPDPSSDEFTFGSPFILSSINLPLDSSGQIFNAYIQAPNYSSFNIFYQKYIGSKWNVNATANPAGTNPDWFLTTNLLPNSVQNFKFRLSYYDQDNINNAVLRASNGYPTTVVLNASAEKTIGVTLIDGNWITRTQTVPFSSVAIIQPLPITNLYAANYYNLANTNVNFTNIWAYNPILKSNSTTIYHNFDSIIFNQSEQIESLFFTSKDIGLVSLSATTVFSDVDAGVSATNYYFSNIIEVLDTYDDVEPHHYNGELSPVALTHSTSPRISPNEWVTQDNINTIVDKVLYTINELDQYTSVYKKTNQTTGRLEQQFNFSGGYTTTLIPSSYSTQDGSITTFFNNNLIYSSVSGTPLSSLTVFSASTTGIEITANYFAVNFTPILTGLNYKWISPYIEPQQFANWTIPFLDSSTYFTGAVVLPISQMVVVSYTDHFNLLNNAYSSSVVDTKTKFDDIFNFQNISALGTTSKDYIIVLDAAVPRVSVYTVVDNQIKLFTTWGNIGSKQSKQGFKNPLDLHIDSNDAIWIADTGNNCIKKLTITGKSLLTITNNYLDTSAPISLCVDSQQNVHVLTTSGIYVFDSFGNYSFSYSLPSNISATKINTSYNREMIYVTHSMGVIKYFRTGTICENTFENQLLVDGTTLTGYNSIFQDQFRNLFITVKDQIVRVADLMKIQRHKAITSDALYWKANQMYVHKDEYIQSWVYLKTFHRLWDNIEIFRNSLFYPQTGNKVYVPPTYMKEDILIGQNELVTNAVINRICNQLWTNLSSIVKYFE